MMRAVKFIVVSTLAIFVCSCGGGEDEGAKGKTNVYSLDPSVLDDGAVGAAYNCPVFYSGVTNPAFTATWSITAGSLPPGLTLTPSTATTTPVTGTPTTAGTYNFTVTYLETDGTDQNTASANFQVIVHPTGELFIENGSLPSALVSGSYNCVLTARGGTGVGYSWSISAGSLPPGLALNGNNVTLNWSAFTQTGAVTLASSPRLNEISGICASRSQPGVFWVHDDSNNAASLYAIDSAGNLLQRYDVATTNGDWEDICLGPGPVAGADYLYIGDVGDNGSVRSDCHLLRVQEPAVPVTPQAPINLSFEAFYFTYPGGSQNCETLLIDWDTGTPYLVEKTAGTVRVHRFPMPLSIAWTAGSPTTLISVTSTVTGALLTGGDASLDARRIILRNGGSANEYARPMGASFDALFTQTGTPMTVPGGQQYEAICYSADGTKLFTVTELAGQASQPIWSANATPGPNTTTISGTPTTIGGYTFTVQVKDSAGNVASRQLTIVIN